MLDSIDLNILKVLNQNSRATVSISLSTLKEERNRIRELNHDF